MARDQVAKIRMTKREKWAVARAAKAEGRSLSDFARRVLLGAIGYATKRRGKAAK